MVFAMDSDVTHSAKRRREELCLERIVYRQAIMMLTTQKLRKYERSSSRISQEHSRKLTWSSDQQALPWHCLWDRVKTIRCSARFPTRCWNLRASLGCQVSVSAVVFLKSSYLLVCRSSAL